MLFEAMYTDCTKIDKISISDGEGGFITEYTDGAPFSAAITLDTSTQARIAQKQGVNSVYTVTIPKNASLNFGDIFRREEDKQIFRVTGDSKDKETPKIASFHFAKVAAEKWELPL
jgi:hypothetical protein